MDKFQHTRSKGFLIHINDQKAGFFTVQEMKAFKGFLSAVMLDRGPVWLEGFESEENFMAFIKAFQKLYPKRIGRRLRLIPEIGDSEALQGFMKESGYRHKPHSRYQTAIVDLRADENTLRAGLKKNWRGALNKAEKQGFSIEWDWGGGAYSWLMQVYMRDRMQKNYDGPSPELMKALAESFLKERGMLIARVINKSGEPVAAALFFTHGPGATYQIGWTGQEGRECGAQNLILWQSALYLKQKRNIKTLDLGGMNDQSAKNIKKFKQGMGGENRTLPGLYT